jgi:hypothetical protein
MQNVYGPLIQACRRNTTVIVSAHTVKGFDRELDEDADIAAIRGSGAVVASSSVVLLYKKPAPALGKNVRFLRVGRTRLELEVPEDRYVTLTPEGFSVMGKLEREMQKLDTLDDRVRGLVERLEPVETATLKEEWSGNVNELTASLKRQIDGGTLTRSGAGKRGDPYTYSVFRTNRIDPDTDTERTESNIRMDS